MIIASSILPRMRIRDTLWFGFLVGALPGPIVLWLLAALSLIFPVVEIITQPIFALTRWTAGLLAPSGSADDGTVALLWVINGLATGLMGMLVQLARRRLRQRA
jgi:hypothetical protein